MQEIKPKALIMGSTKASTALNLRGALKITAAHRVATTMWPIV